MAYSTELKLKALAYYDTCKDVNLVMSAFGISRDSLFRWKRQFKQTGNLANQPRTNRPRKVDRQALMDYVAQNPDKYLYEIAEVFGCTSTAIAKILKSMNITLKKRPPPTKNKIHSK